MTCAKQKGYNMNMSENVFDTVIVGSGPAGLTAGLYAARGGDRVAIVCGETGGLAATAAKIENYPGVRSTDGFALCYAMLEQAKAAGAILFFDRAVGFELAGEQKSISLGDGQVLCARKVILAMGCEHRRLGLDNEEALIGKGISYCATCDGALFRGKPVAVVGGGNTAAAEALYLSKLASHVYLIHRRDALRADKAYADELASSPVEVLWDSVVVKLIAEDKLSEIEVKNLKTDKSTRVLADCVFVAIGQVPRTSGLEGIALDKDGFVITDEFMRTSQEGVYAAGDIRSKPLRQIVTACADGAIAAQK